MTGKAPTGVLTQDPTIAEQFAAWVSGLRFADLPPDVVEQAKQAVADTVGVMVAGAATARVAPYRRLVGDGTADGPATITGEQAGFRSQDAAFVNAIYAHSSELDDIFLAAGGHPGVVTVPAALATAEQLDGSGADLLTAVVAGYEIMHRSINPIFPHTQRRGFQGTGLAGPFGSAAVAGSLRGLDARTLANAFGIAGCSSSGLMEYDQSGGESKRLYAGLGSRAGIEAAALAADGVTGPLTIYEGRRGVFHAFADHADIERATEGLGAGYRIATHRHVKPYPVVASIHGALDALRVLVPKPVPSSEIRRVTITVPQLALSHGGAIRVPTDTLSAQFSFAYAVAVWVLTGTVDVHWFEDEAFRGSSEVAAVCALVEVVADTQLERDAQQGGGTVRVEFADGRAETASRPIPSGRPDNPLTAEERRDRFARLTRPSLGAARADELYAALAALDTAPSVAGVTALLRKGK